MMNKKLVEGDDVVITSGIHRGKTGKYLGRDSATNHAQVKVGRNTVLIVEERRVEWLTMS